MTNSVPIDVGALTAELSQARARIAELEKALKWALPLAERSLEFHRTDRLRAGHHDIGAKRGTDIGLWDDEVNARNDARAALSGDNKEETRG